MKKKKALIVGAGGAAGIVAIAAAAFALAPAHRGLAALDLDGDGQIVSSGIQQSARQRFAELDRNDDGRLAGDELRRGHHRDRHGHDAGRRQDGFGGNTAADPTAEPAAAPAFPVRQRRGLAAADSNGDNAVDLLEFYARFSARAARADANRDGIISAEELAAARSQRRGHDR